MLNKFAVLDSGVASDDPRLRVMETWAAFSQEYLMNIENVGAASRELIVAGLWGEDPDYATRLEGILHEKSPELVLAGNALRRSLDEITGWSINWLQRERRETAPISGWVVGSLVGGDSVMLGYRAWLEIGNHPDATSGPFFQLAQMYEIELRPIDEH